MCMPQAWHRTYREVIMQFAENIGLVITPQGRALGAVPNAPRLSQSPVDVLHEVSVVNENGAEQRIQVPLERPLTIVLDGRELVTLMTLGASPEWLILGYLRNQRILESVATIESVTVDWSTSAAVVETRAEMKPLSIPQPPLAASGCGIGTAFRDLARQMAPLDAPARIARYDVLQILETMRDHDAIHRAAGSVHSCALFRGADLLLAVEDVSRHNGVDIVSGWMAYHGVSGSDKILFTTGRLTGEMILKAAHNGIPIMVSRNGVTALSLDLAAKLGMTLLGRAANRRFTCYCGAERLGAETQTR
jgi:FdhD protein